ncbi:MAG: LURP-one-related family protein [Verrucomicrobiota bacterium JB022]|nr:LURP-one-related family protein [Verrucomicrobiota bacterium JB022]
MQYPLSLSFKIVAIAPQIQITDAAGTPLLYVRQKAFKMKEEIEVFTDDSRSKRLYTIKADRILDFSATYTFRNEAGDAIGSMKRHGMRSLWRTHYEIMGDNGEVIFEIREKNPWVKMADGIFGEIPIVGMFSGYMFNPTYEVRLPGQEDQVLFEMIKKPAFFESSFELQRKQELGIVEEYRVLLSLLMMVLLERDRG